MSCGSKDGCSVPCDVVSRRSGVMSWSGLDECRVCRSVEWCAISEDSFVLFGAVDDGTLRLSIVVGRAVITRNFVDDILRHVGRRSSLRLRQQVT